MPFNTLQGSCTNPPCVLEAYHRAEEKRKRKELREGRAKLKTRSQWIKDAQIVFNRYCKARDEHLPCISCGSTKAQKTGYRGAGNWHAGHYRSVGANPELRFHEENCHKQCASPCNTHLSGNLVEYRKGLIEKIGLDRVEYLEGPHEPKNYSVDDLIDIRQEYTLKLKDLRAKREFREDPSLTEKG